jgi:DNA-binding transcriptional ArsR family regulator
MAGTEEVTDAHIIKAMGHPLRMRILEAFNAGERSPRELATELGEPLGNVSYHVRMLVDLGLLQLVRTTQKRGALEHHYVLAARPVISDLTWSRLPGQLKATVTRSLLDDIAADVGQAAGTGGFERPESSVTRLPLVLDARGWKEASRAAAQFEDKLKQIEQRATERLRSAGGGEPEGARAVLMLFQAPPHRTDAEAPVRNGDSTASVDPA